MFTQTFLFLKKTQCYFCGSTWGELFTAAVFACHGDLTIDLTACQNKYSSAAKKGGGYEFEKCALPGSLHYSVSHSCHAAPLLLVFLRSSTKYKAFLNAEPQMRNCEMPV